MKTGTRSRGVGRDMSEATGILPAQAIAALHAAGGIRLATPFAPDQIQPASLDLRLGTMAYRIRASFLPGPGVTVAERLKELTLHAFPLTEGAVLETGCVYLVPLVERLILPGDISATANPKSSTGRLDVFTRVIVDGSPAFDTIPAGYGGPLYAEISPRTFPVLVRTGSRLSQIRFRRGQALLSDAELTAVDAAETLARPGPAVIRDGLHLSIDLAGSGPDNLVGWRARKYSAVVDVDAKAACAVADFWEPIPARPEGRLILDPDAFYILVSREAVHVPPMTAAEMVPFDPLVGEFRVHYAGFFDPGFGHGPSGGEGARAVLEVRNHEVPFLLNHGQVIGRLVYERMAARPQTLYGAGIGSNYQAQGLKLSKHFRA